MARFYKRNKDEELSSYRDQQFKVCVNQSVDDKWDNDLI